MPFPLSGSAQVVSGCRRQRGGFVQGRYAKYSTTDLAQAQAGQGACPPVSHPAHWVQTGALSPGRCPCAGAVGARPVWIGAGPPGPSGLHNLSHQPPGCSPCWHWRPSWRLCGVVSPERSGPRIPSWLTRPPPGLAASVASCGLHRGFHWSQGLGCWARSGGCWSSPFLNGRCHDSISGS